MLWRRLLLLAFVPYVLWLVFAYRYHLVDGVNLGVHETGHFIFRPFGETMHFLGGSLAQLLFPLAFVVHFARRREWYEAGIMAIWLAEAMMYLAEYVGDAKARALPLVGGHIHDWRWLLTRWGMLDSCETLAAGLHGCASLLAIGALFYCAKQVMPGAVPPGVGASGDEFVFDERTFSAR